MTVGMNEAIYVYEQQQSAEEMSGLSNQTAKPLAILYDFSFSQAF